jgi:hypothetical protein
MRKYFLINAKHDHSLVKIEDNEDQEVNKNQIAETLVEDSLPHKPTYASIVCPHQPEKKSSGCKLCSTGSKLSLVEDKNSSELAAVEDTENNFNYKQGEIIKYTANHQPLHRLMSYIFFKESNMEYLDGLHNFLTRVTSGNKTAMPENFMRLCNESRVLKENDRLNSNPPTFLCPYIKAFGKCKRHLNDFPKSKLNKEF